MKLYELSVAMETALDEAFDPDTGEITAEGEARIAELVEERDAKALALAVAIKNLDAEEAAYRTEANRLLERARSCARRTEWLRQYLAQYLPDGEKLKDARAAIGWGTTDVLEIAECAVLPDRYQRIKMETDKAALKKDIKNGVQVAGAAVVTKRYVTIR